MSARRLALDVLRRVSEGGYADRCLDHALKESPFLDPRDRALATELVYGILRLQNRLDFALNQFTRKPLKKLEPDAQWLLRLGAYQILELDRIPGPVAVYETVNLTKRVGLFRLTGLINAVLRRLLRAAESLQWPDPAVDPVVYLTWRLSLPKWLAQQFFRDLGQEAISFAASLLEPAPFSIRVNTLKISRAAYLQKLAENGHTAAPNIFAPEGLTIKGRGSSPLPGDAQGWYQVQDEASMLISHLVAPKPNERVIDVCAAPGGKTTHLASLSDNQATIDAVDLHSHRVRLIDQGAKRLGATRITSHIWDMTDAPAFLATKSYDAVLVDAPCSGLGVLRRNPEIRWRLHPDDLVDLANRQKQILKQSAQLVKPGGRLIYSVCTVSGQETQEVIDSFLLEHSEFSPDPFNHDTPQTWAVLFDELGQFRSWPHRHGLDGFFAVRLRRQPD
ncbi:MAG: 16S rRNA (cytosine(967)-C(5))-methyltransferase RsmB [Deltaproteobacteria bacterium]|jgi:16S rRNA (cytosine967-C5)-methyltransferase|nr:16S rRNA (cytosine(967)-C(5))-methyltransferase RsmB [Deltaproteobacteria bacterium]MBW2519476.1 16S rRNA (cytosine(967)-C(5))-methyltransferase RsmB [Deltaproteobacteria bacterium]